MKVAKINHVSLTEKIVHNKKVQLESDETVNTFKGRKRRDTGNTVWHSFPFILHRM